MNPAPRPRLAVQLVTAGTAACIADIFTFPLDTAKVRLQVQGEEQYSSSSNSHECPPGEGGAVGVAGRGVAGTLSHIARTEGARALYSGLVPGLQRQMAFSAIRIGAYERVSFVRIALEYNKDCALIAIFGILTKTTSKQSNLSM